jgi:hypothetical protein
LKRAVEPAAVGRKEPVPSVARASGDPISYEEKIHGRKNTIRGRLFVLPQRRRCDK